MKSFPVFGDDGQIGTLLAPARFLDDRADRLIRLDDGREIEVPANALQVRPDGSFYLARSDALLQNGGTGAPLDPVLVPAPLPPGLSAQLSKEPLFESGYDIETVTIDKIVDHAVPERREGDTLILPVLEEVWVVEKKLMLRQEIRITPKRQPIEKSRTIAAPRESATGLSQNN